MEKAGVYRKGKPAISGEPNPPSTIASEAARLGACLRQVGIDFRGDEHEGDWDYHGLHHWSGLPKPALPLMNAVTVLAALESLGLPLAESAIRDGLTNARLAGRMQQLQTSPLVIVDVAHNPHSAAYLASQLRLLPGKGRRRAVVGMLKDKDMAGSLAELDGLIDEWFWQASTARARPRPTSWRRPLAAAGARRSPLPAWGMPTAPPWPHRVLTIWSLCSARFTLSPTCWLWARSEPFAPLAPST